MSMRKTLVAVLIALAPAAVFTQQPPATPADSSLAFEVASIKLNNSGDNRVGLGAAPNSDRFNATNVTLRLLIRQAYQIQDFQMDGGPKWLDTERYDIVAKAPAPILTLVQGRPPAGPGAPGPLQFMLRALLADRFKLAVHNETKEQSVYALVKARSDGKLGSRLTPSTTDCAALFRGGRGAPPPPVPGERPPCGMMLAPNRMLGGAMSMAQLAQALSPRVNRVVLDRTGLTGAFVLDLEFTPDQPGPGGALQPGGGPQTAPSDGPSIYTAIQEQLGLKLDSQRGPVDVLVIDHAEQPTTD